MTAWLELRVAELDCADEARQIHTALGRMDGVLDVQIAVSSRTALVAYDPERVAADAIQRAITDLGMTVTAGRAHVERRHRSLGDRLGWALVSVVAVFALLGIAGERLGLIDAVADRIPAWLAVSAVLVGGYPIFRNIARAARNGTITAHALMTLGIAAALAIGQYAAAAVIVFCMRLADFIEGSRPSGRAWPSRSS